MSLQMSMRMDGVTGESSSFAHKDWFDVISWNWGMTSNRKSAKIADGDAISLNEISIVKNIGIDSADIRLLYSNGSVIPTIDFSIRPETAKRQAATKYVDIRLEGVVIKSIVTGGNIEDKLFKEHITLLFDKINFEYSKLARQSADGKESAPEQGYKFGWDVVSKSEWK